MIDMSKLVYNNQEGTKYYHNNVPTWNKYPKRGYYIYPTVTDGGEDVVNTNYGINNNTVLSFSIVPGGRTGDCWVGSMYGFRFFSPDGWNVSMLDVADRRENIDYIIDENTPKINVRMYNYGVTVTDVSGNVLINENYTPVTDAFGAGLVSIRRLPGLKIYKIKIEDANWGGLVFDGVVDENGLYDNVSGTYVSLEYWGVGNDDN